MWRAYGNLTYTLFPYTFEFPTTRCIPVTTKAKTNSNVHLSLFQEASQWREGKNIFTSLSFPLFSRRGNAMSHVEGKGKQAEWWQRNLSPLWSALSPHTSPHPCSLSSPRTVEPHLSSPLSFLPTHPRLHILPLSLAFSFSSPLTVEPLPSLGLPFN